MGCLISNAYHGIMQYKSFVSQQILNFEYNATISIYLVAELLRTGVLAAQFSPGLIYEFLQILKENVAGGVRVLESCNFTLFFPSHGFHYICCSPLY